MSQRERITRRSLMGRLALGLTGLGLSLSRAGAAPKAMATPAEVVRIDAPIRAVTAGPKAHFFGYYDKCPWDASGRYLLGMEIGYCDRNPEPGEPLTVGLIDTDDGNRFVELDRTLAWSWQQGTMLQWLGSAPDRRVVYNTLDEATVAYQAVIRDIIDGSVRTLPRAIYALSLDGTQALTLDYERVNRLRPGYGYLMVPERDADDPAPTGKGIYQIDIESGRDRLILPLAEVAARDPDERFQGSTQHWFNHLQFNPSGTRFIVLHRWKRPDRGWWTRLYTARPDGSDLRLHADEGLVSHFDWRDDRTILAWARVEGASGFFLIDVETNEATRFAPEVLTRDGHCSYSPDRRWILNDTYPDRDRLQHLMVIRSSDRSVFEVGAFYLAPELRGPFRCDLHPRWNRDGTKVCIDSAHIDKTRQMYVVDVSDIVG